ncbi:MAG: hypothetical protein EOP38_09720 [Rubrivivax sp.]|nr:MAG: hypothetical protein EOP38_09720 [Rubrivivax sp.]
MKRQVPWLAAIVAALLCLTPLIPAWASGGDGFIENEFAPESFVTGNDLPGYGQGQLGVVPSTYWRVYQFLAYRAASGQALTDKELASLHINGWKIGALANREDEDPAQARDAWLAARQAVHGALPVQVDTDKYDEATYAIYTNCPADALRRAALTLNERLKADGGQWTRVWLANQDAVFANCALATSLRGGKPKPVSPMPAALPLGAPAWLKLDHAYQTAAAQFYAGQFDAARARFLAIAQNSASPWQKWGVYLAARCLIRKATLERGASPNADPKADEQRWRALLETARGELARSSKTFPAARQLMDWVDARIRPQQRVSELARVLASGRFTPESARLLSDYLLILDTVESEMLAAREPLTAWIGAMQASGSKLRPQAMAKAREQWKAKRDALWLMPLLAQAKAGELSEDELKAAALVPATSPAHLHLQYHLARLAILQGHADEADTRVSAVLQAPLSTLSTATRNRWLGLKMLTDNSREGFFKAALRTPADTVRGVPITDEGSGKQSVTLAPAQAPPAPDQDYGSHLFRQFSLAELQRARPFTKQVPTTDFAGVVWTRAVILGDFATADDYTDELMVGRETTRHLFQRFKAAVGPQAKRDAAMIILINVPELNPALMRSVDTDSRWGCGPGSHVPAVSEEDGGLPSDELLAVWPRFLPEASRSQAEREMKTLLALPKRSDYLAPFLFDWARRQPQDPEVPKALHFFVASTRMECPVYDDRKAPRGKSNSQQAFELLHKRYPRSEWAAKTKYYF